MGTLLRFPLVMLVFGQRRQLEGWRALADHMITIPTLMSGDLHIPDQLICVAMLSLGDPSFWGGLGEGHWLSGGRGMPATKGCLFESQRWGIFFQGTKSTRVQKL